MQPAPAALLANYRLQPTRVRLVARLGCEIHRVTARAPDGNLRELAPRISPPSRADAAPIDSEVAWGPGFVSDVEEVFDDFLAG